MAGKKAAKKKIRPVNSSPVASQQPMAAQAAQLMGNITQLMEIGQQDTAINLLATLLQIDPVHPEGLKLQGELLMQHGTPEQAIESLSVASYQRPNDAKLFATLGKVHLQLGHQRASISALSRVVELVPNSGATMTTLGALYYSVGMRERGEYWVEKGTRQEPVSYGRRLKSPKLRVLVLRTALSTDWSISSKSFEPALTEGHNNLSSMFDKENIETVRLFVDYVDDMPELLRKLPKIDVIYNSITDADRCAEALKKAEKVCEKLGVPVINHPADVLKTSRAKNYERFKNEEGVILPKSVKYENVTEGCAELLSRAIEDHGFSLPVIIRLAGFQGGKHMQLVKEVESHDFSELDAEIAKSPLTVYVIQYHEVGFRDDRVPKSTLYPKFRAFMINNILYQAHFLVVPDNFNVRRPPSNAFFEEHPWLKRERDHFLQDPESYLPVGAWRALENAMQKVGLDYFGVDFACHYDAQGKAKIVVFEANASMRNMLHDQGPEHPIYKAYFKMNLGVHEMLVERSEVEPWDYEASLIKSEEARNA